MNTSPCPDDTKGITTVGKPRADGLRYFVRVGGGYQGYNASAYNNAPP